MNTPRLYGLSLVEGLVETMTRICEIEKLICDANTIYTRDCTGVIKAMFADRKCGYRATYEDIKRKVYTGSLFEKRSDDRFMKALRTRYSDVLYISKHGSGDPAFVHYFAFFNRTTNEHPICAEVRSLYREYPEISKDKDLLWIDFIGLRAPHMIDLWNDKNEAMRQKRATWSSEMGRYRYHNHSVARSDDCLDSIKFATATLDLTAPIKERDETIKQLRAENLNNKSMNDFYQRELKRAQNKIDELQCRMEHIEAFRYR
jgi:hypothetical protein